MNKIMVIINPTSGREKILDYDVSIPPSEMLPMLKNRNTKRSKFIWKKLKKR